MKTYISKKEVKQRYLDALKEKYKGTINHKDSFNCPEIVSTMDNLIPEVLCKYCKEMFPKKEDSHSKCPCDNYSNKVIKKKVKEFFADEKWDTNKNACLRHKA